MSLKRYNDRKLAGKERIMSKATGRDFDKAAATWDEKPRRRLLAEAVAAGIAGSVQLHREQQVLEYGCGTGLCGLQLAPGVGHLTAVDTSAGMLEELRKKCRALGLENVTPVLIEPDNWPLPAAAYDLVFSSMVLHHVAATRTLLQNFQRALRPDGWLALADLDLEDGTFHDDPSGVAHHGFDPPVLMSALQELGFVDLETRTVHTIHKQHDAGERSYPVFLITGRNAG
jgi:ubiquinone/menaquinone biosynthesis C-methylase UbiE